MEVKETQRDASTGNDIKMLDLYFLILQRVTGMWTFALDICCEPPRVSKTTNKLFRQLLRDLIPFPGTGILSSDREGL